MAVTTGCNEGREVELDLPTERRYESNENAKLDEALTEAIKRAEDVNNDYLAHLLRNELESLYHGSKLGL